METFGNFLKMKRKSKMTQRELAKKLEVGYPYISRLENGIDKTPSDLLLYKIAKILDIDEALLFQKAGRIPKDLQENILKSKYSFNVLYKNIDKEKKQRTHKVIKENNTVNNLLKTKNNILIINPTTGEIKDASDTIEKFYGYSLKELKNKRILDLNTLPEQVVREKMKEASLLKENTFNFKHLTKYGEVKDIQVFSTPFSINKQILLCSTIFDNNLINR